MHVTMEHALEAVEAARKEAVKLKTQMCIAVVDSGANLKAFVRMDDAWVGSIDIAIKKAKTAVFFGMPTGEIGKLSQPGKSLYGIEHSNEGLITFPGGLPIVDEEGVLVGAIGVSGSSVENDNKVAEAGLKVVGSASATCRRIPGAPELKRANKRKAGHRPAFFIRPSARLTSSRRGRPCCRQGARDRWRCRTSGSTPADPASRPADRAWRSSGWCRG